MWSNCVLVCLLATVSVAYTYSYSEGRHPTFAACNQDILDKIKEYKASKAPISLPLFKKGEEYFRIHAVIDKTKINCVFLKYEGDKLITTMVSSVGAPAYLVDYTVQEEGDGLVGYATNQTEALQGKWKVTSIFKTDEAVIFYICSDEGESHENPLLQFWLTKKGFKDNELKESMDDVYNIIKTWGLNFAYKYYDECFESV